MAAAGNEPAECYQREPVADECSTGAGGELFGGRDKRPWPADELSDGAAGNPCAFAHATPTAAGRNLPDHHHSPGAEPTLFGRSVEQPDPMDRTSAIYSHGRVDAIHGRWRVTNDAKILSRPLGSAIEFAHVQTTHFRRECD